MNVREIYELLNTIVSVKEQEKWDNSGFLIGDEDKKVEKIVFALDVTKSAVDYANKINADLIISHHPVIFDAIKSIKKDDIAYKLISTNISAISLHTPLDIAECGMNRILFDKFSKKIDLKNDYKILEVTQENGNGFGFVAELNEAVNTDLLAQKVSEALNETDVRYFDTNEKVSTIAVCSGSGSSMIEYAKNIGVDAFITGDVKQDRWIAAENIGISLIDAGHFGTEKFFYEPLIDLLKDKAECFIYEKKPYKTYFNDKAGER